MKWLLAAAAVGAAVVLAIPSRTLAVQESTELKVGDPFPGFQLKGTDGKTYSLDQFKGKSAIVMAWYPRALTGG